MEQEALTQFIRRAETSQDQEYSIVELLKMLQRKEISSAEIQAHYKRERLPVFNACVKSFGEGNLFMAQRHNFTNWIAGRDYAHDLDKALTLKADGEMCGLTTANNQTMYDVWKFVIKMIIFHPYQRKAQADFMGENKMREAWFRRCQVERWNWMPQ